MVDRSIFIKLTDVLGGDTYIKHSVIQGIDLFNDGINVYSRVWIGNDDCFLVKEKPEDICKQAIEELRDGQMVLSKGDADYLRFLKAWIHTTANNILDSATVSKRLDEIINKIDGVNYGKE